MKLSLAGTVLLCAVCAALTLSTRLAAGEPKKPAEVKASAPAHITTPDTIKWAPAPPSLPAGAEVALLDGDMKREGSLATWRARVPDGWKVPPHFHPADEHVTVLQGALWMGMGDKFDESALHEVPTGGFHAVPKGVHHYAMAKGQTIYQVHAIAPWGITYVNPADDPSKKAAEK
jgi:mannose-6-phosphate isomerase-like protein (cupin superfamily)